MLRLHRFLSIIALLILVAVSCHAEGECANINEEGECLNPDAPVTPEVAETTEEDPNCPSRALVIRCAGKYLDTNQNGKLERAELEAAINRYVSWENSRNSSLTQSLTDSHLANDGQPSVVFSR